MLSIADLDSEGAMQGAVAAAENLQTRISHRDEQSQLQSKLLPASMFRNLRKITLFIGFVSHLKLSS